jgi:hypothetical protein
MLVGAVFAAPAAAEDLQIRNNSGGTVCYVYVSPCAVTQWGNDILGDQTLTPGDSATVNVNAGCWDLKAEDCNHAVLATRRVDVSGDMTWTLAGATAATPPPPAVIEPATFRVTVKNRSGQTVCYVYVSSCSSSDWGADILEEDVLSDGANARVRVQGGCWDFKAEDCDHTAIATSTGVQVNDSTEWRIAAPRAPETARITVKNRTDDTICYVYVSACESDTWGGDILEQDVLSPGENAVVRVELGCWDLRATDCDQNEVATRRGLNVQRSTSWTVQ